MGNGEGREGGNPLIDVSPFRKWAGEGAHLECLMSMEPRCFFPGRRFEWKHSAHFYLPNWQNVLLFRKEGRVGAAVRPSYAPHLSEGGEINDRVSLAHTENKLQGVFWIFTTLFFTYLYTFQNQTIAFSRKVLVWFFFFKTPLDLRACVTCQTISPPLFWRVTKWRMHKRGPSREKNLFVLVN